MRNELFRKEAITAQRVEPFGSTRLAPPRFGWYFFAAGFVLVAALLALLIGGHYTKHETAQGALVPHEGLLPVTTPAAGVVVRTLFTEGAEVTAGQALVEVSGERDSASLGNTHASVIAELKLKASKLESDFEEQQRLAEIETHDLSTHIDILDAQVRQTEAQIALQKARAQAATAIYEQFQQAEHNGTVSKLQILQQRDGALSAQVELRDSTTKGLALRAELGGLRTRLAQQPAALRTKRNETDRQLADVRQSLAETEAQRAIVLRASADGIVTNVLVHAGQSVAAQQLVLTLLPKDSRLEAELWMPARAVGSIAAGDPVVLRYGAFPYQVFGQKLGYVREISRSPLSPVDLRAVLGREVDGPRYRVRVDIESQTIRVAGRDEHLMPGIALDADVLLERRRLVDWIMEPLYGLAQSARTDVPRRELK
jgi:membrane fusion protein